jgi:hypothetical protein
MSLPDPDPTYPASPTAPPSGPPASDDSAAGGAAEDPSEAATPGTGSGGAAEDPASWGRVGEDGTVYVRTADGERAVGAFPDATPEQALAFFTRKYDDLAAQVELLAQRVTAGRVRPSEATAQAERLRTTIADADVVGDLGALSRRLDDILAAVAERRAADEQARQQARAAARAAKEALVAEAEALADSEQWKSAGDRFRELVEAWRAAPRGDRRSDDELWARFRAARTAFDRRRRAHFARLEATQQEVAARKEQIVAEAESLAGSTDWGATAVRFRELMAQWKAAGRAGRADDQRLWERFRAAQDTFFSARSAVFAQRDAAERENLAAKEALAAEAEALLPVTDLGRARSALRDIQARWERIGHVPRGDVDRVEGRLRRVAEEIRAVSDREWRRSDPAARARATETVSALERIIADLDRQLAAARQAGDTKAESAAREALAARQGWLAEARRTLADLSR